MRRVGMIGGTGFGEALVAGTAETVDTDYGPVPVTRGDLGGGREIIYVARHGAGHKIAPHLINHRANIAALSDLGVGGVFATTAVGSLRTEIEPGDFVLLDDFLDFTKAGVVTFFDAPGQVRHTDMGRPYDRGLRETLLATAGDIQTTVHPRGTYLCLSGPRYETPAEVRLFASWGASVVGMTGAPEAILCRELGLPYAGVSLVTNFGCGLAGDETLSHADVEARMAQGRDALAAWLLRAARNVPA